MKRLGVRIIIIRTDHLKLLTLFKALYITKQYNIKCVFRERSNVFLRVTAVMDEMSGNERLSHVIVWANIKVECLCKLKIVK